MRIVNFFKKIAMSVVVLLMCLIIYGYYSVPDVINTIGDDEIRFSGIYTVSINKETKQDIREPSNNNKDYESSVTLFNKIPVKTNSTIIGKRKYVVPSGEIIGLRMYSEGVMIVSADSVETSEGKVNPSEKSGIKAGDLIVSIDGKNINSAGELTALIADSGGKALSIVYVRNNNEFSVSFTPVLSDEGKYRAGWWVRDSAAGIGTMTYYEKNSGIFGGLGHGICDSDTDLLLPLYYGDIVKTEISGCYKGTKGKAGELCGALSSTKIGEIYKNCDCGVYGVLDVPDESKAEIPVALKSEVQPGKASILCSVDNEGVREYDVEIEKTDIKDNSSRNLVIKITDKRLLSVTGGIVQGMSGSPIIQNGRLVGAVTHVLINDPERGYGIFIENMLEASE